MPDSHPGTVRGGFRRNVQALGGHEKYTERTPKDRKEKEEEKEEEKKKEKQGGGEYRTAERIYEAASMGSTTTMAYTRKLERRLTFFSSHRSLIQSSTSAMRPVATNTLCDVIISLLWHGDPLQFKTYSASVASNSRLNHMVHGGIQPPSTSSDSSSFGERASGIMLARKRSWRPSQTR